jgi:putative endonuclease
MTRKQYYVYIMTNRYNTVLYTGVTNDLLRRASEHRAKAGPGFTSRYNVTKLVYYEAFDDVNAAIAREKQLKAGSRQKKVDLVSTMNSEWRDLYDDLR